MKFILCFLITVMPCITILSVNAIQAQNCPSWKTTTTISSFPNTYYPGQQATVSATDSAGGNENNTIAYEAAGGGGADGSAIINARSGHSNLTVQANGGNGSTNWNDFTYPPQLASKEVLEVSHDSANMYAAITWTSTSDSQLNITLFDAAGHAALIRQYPLRKGVNELLLTNLEALRAGIYLIKASDDASNRNGKLVIHHN